MISAKSFAIFVFAIAFAAGVRAETPVNLIRNAGFEKQGATANDAAEFVATGDVVRRFAGNPGREISSMGMALESGRDVNGDGRHEGSVAQTVGVDPKAGRWFRFSFRGLPQDGFVAGDLFMKAEFFGDGGKSSFDAVTKKIYPLVEQARRDLSVNGDYRTGGAAVWRTYQFDFKLPFPQVDIVRVSAGFRDGVAKSPNDSAFFVDDFSLVRIDDPVSLAAQKTVPLPKGKLLPLGGFWFYEAKNGELQQVKNFDASNANRLLYKAARLENPFAENMSAWLRAGYKKLNGAVASEDEFVPDSVTVSFTDKDMIVHAKNLPNHPTSKFPETVFHGNPNYIQEHNYTYYLPLVPTVNPQHKAMDLNNTNRALPMGAIGVAVNGVVFYNPFDAGMQDASNIMDRCCGHPSPDGRYHYHKYPVCVKSPWADEGDAHSPLIGWAFDGFPIYGPYESAGVMAKDLTGEHALNAFNIHYDPERGWHYHVTPGKFPYIIGGYWGTVDSRNVDHRGPPPGGRPPGFPPGPPL